MLQLVPNRHLKVLPPSDITTWPTDFESNNMTTRYSLGQLSLRPNTPLTIEELTLDTPADIPHGDEASTIEHASVLAKTVLSDVSPQARQTEPSILSNASTQSCCSKQSYANRSGQSERSSLTRSTHYDASVSSLQQRAILANDLDRAKIYALDADVASFLTHLRQIDNNDVDGFLSYTAKIKRHYAQSRA
jgi:hypothetical protein